MSKNTLACSEMVWPTHKDHPGKGEFMLLHHPSFRKQAPWTQLQALFLETTDRPPTFAHSSGNYREDVLQVGTLRLSDFGRLHHNFKTYIQQIYLIQIFLLKASEMNDRIQRILQLIMKLPCGSI